MLALTLSRPNAAVKLNTTKIDWTRLKLKIPSANTEKQQKQYDCSITFIRIVIQEVLPKG